MNLREKVERCLKDFPATRNSDPELTFRIIYEFHREEIVKIGEKWFVSTKILKEIREDNVKRIRAVIQNEEGRFLPTSLEVVRQRRINEIKWREQLGYAIKPETIDNPQSRLFDPAPITNI